MDILSACAERVQVARCDGELTLTVNVQVSVNDHTTDHVLTVTVPDTRATRREAGLLSLDPGDGQAWGSLAIMAGMVAGRTALWASRVCYGLSVRQFGDWWAAREGA